MSGSNAGAAEYILGTGDDELTRLGVQHRIWSDAAAGSWKRAGIGPGSRVLDVGCGPGYATFDLAQLVGADGLALGVDESARFVEHVNAQAKARHLPQVRATIGDVQKLDSGALGGPFDAAYARWTLCWLEFPERAVAGVASALKPGGKFIVHDYFNWKAMTIAPRSRAVDRLIEAAMESYAERHGDMDIGGKLPAMFRAAGLTVSHFEVHSRVARGGGHDSTIAWPVTWWRTYGPKLAAAGRLTQAECAEALAEMDDLERNEDRFYVCPQVYEFIASRT